MLTLLSFGVLLLAGWTAYAFINKGEKKDEITNQLKLLLSNAKETVSNVVKLVLLLFQDTFKKDPGEFFNFKKVNFTSDDSPIQPVELEQVSNTSNPQEGDKEIDSNEQFSTEVIDITNNDEEKAA